jgi:hypothetical protein
LLQLAGILLLNQAVINIPEIEELHREESMKSARRAEDMSHEAASYPKLETVAEVLKDGRNFLAELGSYLLNNAGLFRKGQEFLAKESFIKSVEGLQVFVSFIDQLAAATRLDLAVTEFEGKSIKDSLEELNQLFLEMVSSQERNDWVLLADLMEYELAPQLQRWDGIVVMLGGLITEASE